MKRDPRLRGLSSEHHHALVLARTLERLAGPEAWSAAEAAEVGATFERDIEPHFRVEEDVLLPALRAVGERALVERVEADHAFLRARMQEARAGDVNAARAFGARLRAHSRFEERELFPACEALLPSVVLDEVARRAPKEP